MVVCTGAPAQLCSARPFTHRRPSRAICAVHQQNRGAITAENDTQAAAQPVLIERRQALASVAAVMAAAALGPPAALAESRTALFKQYYDNTDAIHAELHEVLSVDQGHAEEAKQKVAKFRDESNKWVGSYRNTMSLGRKSFAETYAAINTVQGHYTSRGAEAPLAGKIRTAAETKLASAENFLKREKAKDAVPTPK